MDFLDQLIEKIKDMARWLAEALGGSHTEPELELIPIPVRDRQR
ncbi:MAG: DNA topoisomerase I [Acaryochloridaceae cyanobacterium SU_2_1]|nr:DNA topoisomerase I [Acaryochloridaceae cyanobacterium SU_2_1]NJM95386.1 DNA topoisomerase I [Acaryochloridaceae cyanobacterium CSU_5_19]